MNLMKKTLTLILAVALLFLSSCKQDVRTIEYGTEIDPDTGERVASLLHYYGRDYIGDEYLYFFPYHNGLELRFLSAKPRYIFSGSVEISGDGMERVYFPWTMKTSLNPDSIFILADTIITSRVFSGIICDSQTRVVVPLLYYDYIIETGEYGYNVDADQIHAERILPANVSYLFNYTDAPNFDYFFVDLLETTDKLQKPPYDPDRQGYVFGGWYKDAECTESWDFESNTVNISYDESGKRIYEEIRLYAKWETKNWWEFWK